MAEPITRRSALATLGAASIAVAAGTLGAAAPAAAQGQSSQALGLQESVQDGLKRVFGSRPMKDGAAVIKLDIPPIAENGAVVPVNVEVNAPMTLASYVKNIWIVADKNRIPIVARVTLTPEAGQAFVGANIRLGETTDVRAVVEQSDGTLLTAKREVKVTVGGCGG
jgi:sulfur-oxidizing protein SoxY